MKNITKEQFNNFNKNTVYCRSCKRDLPKNNFSYSYINLDGTASTCKYCNWVERKGGLLKIDGFTPEQIQRVAEFLIFEESNYINNLADIVCLSIDDLIILIQKLKIGNKKCKIETKCSFCGKKLAVYLSVYLNNKNFYCSKNCYWNHKPQTIEHGEKNSCYKRISTNCANCNQEIFVIPFDYQTKNSWGETHNFCSQVCYWEYRSKYYRGERAVNYNRKFSPSQLEKMRITIIKNSRSGKRLNSKIQLMVNDILDAKGIKYIREYMIKYYAIDNYLEDSGLMIEVMGDYWHASPIKYNQSGYLINSIQKKTIIHDKQKLSYIRNHLHIEVLYLWEFDIENNFELCMALIDEYISKKGVLKNYNSFNWSYKDGCLFLNNNIITPYQNMNIAEYRNIIKSP